jgi:hypothetical protein
MPGTAAQNRDAFSLAPSRITFAAPATSCWCFLLPKWKRFHPPMGADWQRCHFVLRCQLLWYNRRKGKSGGLRVGSNSYSQTRLTRSWPIRRAFSYAASALSQTPPRIRGLPMAKQQQRTPGPKFVGQSALSDVPALQGQGLASTTTVSIQSGSTDPEELRCDGAASISELGPATKGIGEVSKTRSSPHNHF